MTEKQEIEALRRQKREWELERANLLSEQEYLETKVKDLGIAFTKQCFELEEAKHKISLYHQALTKDCEASTKSSPEEALEVFFFGKDNQNG